MTHNTDITPTKVQKDSKLGVIPDGWKIKTLDELGTFSKGKGISKNEILEEGEIGLPGIRYAEIYTMYDFYTDNFKSHVNKESAENSNEIQFGDILFAGSGETLEDIGKSIAYVGKQKAYAGGDIIIFRQETEDSKYLGFLLNNDGVRRQLHKLGQGHSVVHVYGKSLKKVKLPIPPLPEQQKIAQILATWDVAIKKQEAIIAKKQELKNALMQQLLTGKKRFVGFDDDWEYKRMDKLINYIGGEAFKSKNMVDNGVKWLKIANVGIGEIKWGSETTYLPIEFIESYPKYVLHNNDVVMALTRPILNDKLKIARIKKEDENSLLNQRVSKLVTNNQNVLDYIYYVHQLPNFIYAMNSMMAGTDPPNISLKELSSYHIHVPKPKEQQKIAEILITADNEITALQQQLQQLKTQKKGLMQQLLTGKIRVKK
ncbi:restriction endonuclease subunit S [Xanthomarina gelatinilytica]|uniref:restriction endonuclease subunit S n=1 Tax=Xanthomarina gelatinilytica TaxID=1137281 RepID=UPI003AA94BC8